MPAKHPNPRPAAGGLLIGNPLGPRLAALLVVLLLAGLMIVPAAAETIIDVDLYEAVDTSGSNAASSANVGSTQYDINGIYLKDITQFHLFSYLVIEVEGNQGYWANGSYMDSGRYDIQYEFLGETWDGVVYVSRQSNALGTITETKFTLFFGDWNIGDNTGAKTVALPFKYLRAAGSSFSNPSGADPVECGVYDYPNKWFCLDNSVAYDVDFTYASGIPWENRLLVSLTEEGGVSGYDIQIFRTIDQRPYTSTLSCFYDESQIFTSTQHGVNETLWYALDEVDSVQVISPNAVSYNYTLSDDSPATTASVTVYIINSQTGALLADAHILVEGTPGVDDWTEYVNTTLPSGTGSYSLPGIPYQFRILAESPGYTSTGYQYFRAGDTVIVNLEPYIDAPTNESNTFLEFYIRDLNANPLGGATVEVGGQWLYSNNNGYARFEVAKNATYPYTVQKSGYMTISGTATVADGPRYTVNVVLGAGTVPTLTPTPTEPGATPTPDRRTNEQKGQAVIDMIADFAEPIALLAIVATVFGLMQMMMPRRR